MTDWMERAACAEIGGDLWFADQGKSITAARKICYGCPAINMCKQYAVDHTEITAGVWGGLSIRQIIRLRNHGDTNLNPRAAA